MLPTEDKSNVREKAFCEEVEHVIIPRKAVRIIIGDCNAQIDQETVYRSTIGRASLYQISNYNGVRIINFATSKDL